MQLRHGDNVGKGFCTSTSACKSQHKCRSHKRCDVCTIPQYCPHGKIRHCVWYKNLFNVVAEESRGEPNEAAEGSHQGEPGRPSRREGGAGNQELKYTCWASSSSSSSSVGPLFEGGPYAMAATSPKQQSRPKPAVERMLSSVWLEF